MTFLGLSYGVFLPLQLQTALDKSFIGLFLWEVSGSDSGGGWTLVRGRRGTGTKQASTSRSRSVTSPPQSPTTPSVPAVASVMETLRRGEDERRAREAKRARLAEKAREVPAATRSATRSPAPSEPPSAGSSPPMGPPPPPPPLRRPPPPPPLKTVTEAPGPPSLAGHSAQKHREERPIKRSLPWEGSPTDSGGPRARQRSQPGSTPSRSSSADGRLRQSHARIQFGEKHSGAAQYF